jgi:L-aspartate oxidase
MKTDILVIGSGVSGLFFAVKTALKRPDLTITIMTKSKADNSNTRLAQGGIAVVTNNLKESFERHIEDTIKSGGGAGDKEVIEMVVYQAPERLQELLDFEVSFDKNSSGDWDLGLEGGHTEHRILHHKDISGLEIQQKMLLQLQRFPNIRLIENTSVLDLVVHQNQCVGAIFYDKASQTTQFIAAKTILLSSGGSGQLFQHTTNPNIATADGVAMAHRLGAAVKDMAYIQFHPTALFEGERNPYFLISEAVRGFGAYIVNADQKRFVFEYDSRGELATRDVVSKAIGSEMQKSGAKNVFIDCRHLDFEAFYQHFPTITDYCKNVGIDIRKDLIPIVPIAHYQCGGIQVDKDSQTTVKNLFAVGECSCTGLHGKNRLASNSLLEALVFAHQSSEYICKHIDEMIIPQELAVELYPITEEESTFVQELKNELKTSMTSLFISGVDAELIKNKLQEFKKQAQILSASSMSLGVKELQNMIDVAILIAEDKQ